MRFAYLLALTFTLLSSAKLYAQDYRAYAIAGYGNSDVTSGTTNLNESPLGGAVGVEYIPYPNVSFGIDHTHSLGLSPVSFASSYTGVSVRYYFFGMAQTQPLDPEDSSVNLWYFKGWSGYAGLGFGVSLAQIAPDVGATQTANEFGIYYQMRAGLDHTLSSRWGLRLELQIENTFTGDLFDGVQFLGGLLFWL